MFSFRIFSLFFFTHGSLPGTCHCTICLEKKEEQEIWGGEPIWNKAGNKCEEKGLQYSPVGTGRADVLLLLVSQQQQGSGTDKIELLPVFFPDNIPA